MTESRQEKAAGEPSVEVAEKVELLISPRRSQVAKSMGVQLLNAGSMHNIISTIARQPGCEVLREIRPGRKLKTLSTADEATNIYKVRMDVDAAANLYQTAPPNIAVELDSLLSYGQANFAPSFTAIFAQQPGLLREYHAKAQQVRLRVVGSKGEPIRDAQVIVESAGFPQEGVTNNKGEVAINIFAQSGGAQIKSLLIRPSKDFWNKYIRCPSLSLTGVNLVKLHSLSEAIPSFPNNAPYGWGQKYMGLDQLPDEYTGKGIKIAIIDSGADNQHPILSHLKNGIDVTNNYDSKSWAEDIVGHGTHCAGIIAGQPSGTDAIRGFAPEAEIYVFKVFPGGQFSSLIDAIAHCIEIGIDVINMSLGSTDSSEAVEQQIEDAVQHGIACVVAAGNSGGPVQYPARSPNVMAVGAIGMLNEFPRDSWDAQTVIPSTVTADGVFLPTFSCHGPEVSVAAPGVGIVSSVPDKGFDVQSGTSMAAPHITGLAALLLAHHPLFKTTFRQRDISRTTGLFQLIRTLTSPMNLGADRVGAGVPRLFGIDSLFESAKEMAKTEGVGVSAAQPTSPHASPYTGYSVPPMQGYAGAGANWSGHQFVPAYYGAEVSGMPPQQPVMGTFPDGFAFAYGMPFMDPRSIRYW
ncbi:S8 family serine peptidase [Microbulbifer sp. ANSA002]|uniref:S8 family serine peptidase n=1 Tax=unclassified Microbulbifer TaxID=2619833 RepID=UPI0040412CDF